MFSNLRPRWSLLMPILALSLSLCGCDFFLARQSPPAEPSIEMKGGPLQCLRTVPKNLGLFLADDLSENEIHTSFGCLRATLDHFLKFTRGTEKADQYTQTELRSFLNEALPDKHRVSVQFMQEIMSLKTVLLGGSSKIMTKKEIEQARVLMSVLESESLNLRGKMRVLLFQAPKDKVSREELKSAQQQIERSVANILEVSKAEATFYGFDDVRNLCGELNAFLGSNGLLGQLLRWLPMAQKLKVLFLGEKTLAYSQKDWQQVLGWSVRAYGLTLEFVYWIKNLNFGTAEDMERLIAFGDSVFELIESSPVLKERSELSLLALDEVLAESMRTGLFKTLIPLDVLKEGIRRFLLTVIDGPMAQRRSTYEIEFLSSRQLSTLRFEWNVWVLSQKQIDQAFIRQALKDNKTEVKTISYPELLETLSTEQMMRDLQSRPRLRPGEATELAQTWFEWSQLMRSPHPMLWNSEEHLIVLSDYKNARPGFQGMVKVNLLRSLTRLILRGYGTGTARSLWNLNIDADAFSRFEEDFREIGRKISALDPRTPSPADRTFKEASFFTFSGNGDSTLTANELFEELNILSSAGGMISNELMALSIRAGCATDERDVFGQPYLREDCFRKVFRQEFLRVFDGAPGVMALQMKMRGHINEEKFYESLWQLGHAPYSRPGYVEYGELRTYGAVLYYVEILRLVYDRDEDMKLSQTEIQAAAPRFRSYVGERSPMGSFLVDQIFTCLVFEQRKPGADLDTGKCLFHLGLGYDPLGPEALLQVLAVLKADLPPPPQVLRRPGLSSGNRL